MMMHLPLGPDCLEDSVKRIALLLLVPLFVACSNIADDVTGPAPNAVGTVQFSAGAQDVRDRYIVVLRADAADDVAASMAAAGGNVHFRYQRALKGFAATLPPQAVAALQRNPNVDFIVADGIATASGSGTDNSATWGLDRIDQRNLPLTGSYQWTQDGANVTAYILDTGIRTSHTEFGNRASIGYDAIGDGQNGNDCHGHGTHVAGTVGGTEYGVAKAASLKAVRVLNCSGSGTWSQVIAGIDWVASNHVKPAVANMSLGGGANSAVNQAVANAVTAGVTFAVAAGNNNANACNYSPASTPSAITVGSTTSTDVRSSFSNYGTCVDVFAPGSNITSAWYTSNTATAALNGTSMASPHVAGVAALYLSANPTATPAVVAAAIVDGSTPNKVTSAGAGSPNRLLYSLIGGSSPPTNNPPTAAFTPTCTNLACSFNASASFDNDGTITAYAWNFGDGSTGSGVNASRTYTAAGTFTVTLTVTDNGNATNATSKPVTVTAGGGPSLTLTAVGSKVKGVQQALLTWSPAGTAGQQVTVLRTGSSSATYNTPHDGSHTDPIGAKGNGSYQYRICVVGTSPAVCSNTVNVNF
jgi:subtilisin family serine protease